MRARIINANTIEPATGQRQTGAWLDIEDGRISARGRSEPPPAYDGRRIIDAQGRR